LKLAFESGTSDEKRRTASGRLFRARGPATAKARSPSVDLRVAGTVRSDDVTDRRRRRDSMLATGQTAVSVEGSMVLICVGRGIQVHRACTA